MTRTLDDDLAAAAPPIRERTPELRGALLEMVVDTEKEAKFASGPHRKRKIAAIALAATALLGTGTTAAAVGWVATPWWENPRATTLPATSSSGTECSVTYAPRPIAVPAHPVSDADRVAAMSAAAKFLRKLDESTIADGNHDALFESLNARLTEALRQQGLSTHAVSVALAFDCSNGSNQ